MNVFKINVAKIPDGSIFNNMTKISADSSTWVVKVPANWGFHSVDVNRHSYGDYIYLSFKTKAKAMRASKVLNSIDDADTFRRSGLYEYDLVFRRGDTAFMFV